MKKRLAIYLSVIIGCLFIGLSVFYLLRSYENIDFVSGFGNEIYLNVEETSKLNIIHENASDSTKITYTATGDGIISFDLETGIITALKGGESTLTITTTNEDFGPFIFNINVGDGQSIHTPYYIKDVDDLKAIGGTRIYVAATAATKTTPAIEEVSHEWELSAFYKLHNNVDLKDIEWSPIGSYSESKPFCGNFFGDNKTISNLTISKDCESAGLFAYLADFAIIDSVKFDKVSISGNFDYVGTIAGISAGATITRIEVTNSKITAAPNCFLDDKGQEIDAYLMVGGIIGFSDVQYWEGETESSLDGYGYARSFITMCSFQGTITAHNNTYLLSISNKIAELYTAFGGIVGFNAGATVLNNKTEIVFDVPANLAVLSSSPNKKININVGGVIGLTDIGYYAEPEKNVFIATVYPLISNNLSIIACNNLTNKTGGVIGATTIDVQLIEGRQWIYDNYFYTKNMNLTNGGSTYDNSTTKLNEKTLKTKITYTSLESNFGAWDIGESTSVWSITDKETAPTINFLNGIEQKPVYDSEIYTISTIENFVLYYNKMTASATEFTQVIYKKFWLSQSYRLDIDINLAETNIGQIIPIGYDFTFMGLFDGNGHKIYFEKEDAKEIIFTNLVKGVETYKYGAFFAVIGVSAEVKDLTIKGLNIDYAQFVGAIAGINLGSVTNCYVNEMFVKDGQNVGLMTGYNSGTIENTSEEGEEIVYSIITSTHGKELPTISIKDNNKSVYVGGITGYNTGLISNIKIKGDYTIVCEPTEKNIVRVIGGAIGYNNGEIIGCSVEQARIEDLSKVNIFVGGFCGVNNKIIKTSHAGMEEGGLQTIIITEMIAGNQIAGGFVAVLEYDGIIEQCFANTLVKGYYAAGLAADLLGIANECYVKGSIEGEYIAGFACNMAFKLEKDEPVKGGTLTNSYNKIEFIGNSENSIAAGVVLFVRAPAKIEYCFTSNIFTGKGEKYYEAFTNTRWKFSQFLIDKIAPVETLGTLNKVVINMEAADSVNEAVKDNNKIFSDKSQSVYYWTKSKCLGGASDFTEIEFSATGVTAVWIIEEGNYPILANLNLDNISQIVIEDNSDGEIPPENDGEIPPEN